MILNAAVVVSLISLAFTPRDKVLQMQFILLFVQLPTWLLGLSAVEMGLLEYPYRELASVNRTSFIFEYLALPVVCVHLNNHYPWHASAPMKAAYFAGVSLLLTGTEVVLERYTMLINYTGWEWYWTWISVIFIFCLTQKTVAWFFSYR
ncbi:CBO0543 family protein [Sporomusa malonica]